MLVHQRGRDNLKYQATVKKCHWIKMSLSDSTMYTVPWVLTRTWNNLKFLYMTKKTLNFMAEDMDTIPVK